MLEGDAATPHAEIWAFSELLEPLGVEHSLPFALGVAGGAGFLGVGFRYDKDDFSNLHISGWNPFQSSLVAGATRLGLVGTRDETGSRRKADKQLAQALASGERVALWVDGAGVGLAPAALDGMSPTIVVAQQPPSGEILISGGTHPAREVDPARLSAARSRIRSHKHRLLTLRGSEGDVEEAVRIGMAAVAVGSVGGPASNTGAQGIAAMAERIDGHGKSAWRTVFAGDRHLLGALVNLHAFIVREQGLLRGFQAEFDRFAAGRLALPALEGIADAHERLAEQWLRVARTALPADVPGLEAARAAPSAFEIPDQVIEAPFPLSAGEQEELLTDLAAQVTALADAEADVIDELRGILRPDG